LNRAAPGAGKKAGAEIWYPWMVLFLVAGRGYSIGAVVINTHGSYTAALIRL
jgi:hypothetical protein